MAQIKMKPEELAVVQKFLTQLNEDKQIEVDELTLMAMETAVTNGKSMTITVPDEVAKDLMDCIESGVLDPLVKTEEPKQNTSDDEECYGIFMSTLYGYSVWAAVRMRGNVVKLIDVDFYNLPEKRIEDLTELEKSAIIYNFNFRPIKHANGDIVKYKTLKEAIRDLHQRNGMRDWEIERKSPVSEGSDPLNPPYRDRWRKRGNHPYNDGTPRWKAWYDADPQNAADYRAYTRACGNTSNIPTLEVPYSE